MKPAVTPPNKTSALTTIIHVAELSSPPSFSIGSMVVGSVVGSLEGSVGDSVVGSVTASVVGSVGSSVVGSVVGSEVGSVAGSVVAEDAGIVGSVEGVVGVVAPVALFNTSPHSKHF